jgi:4-amino-4-deoxy-L-arabinose transferase-like glycosyltransferase
MKNMRRAGLPLLLICLLAALAGQYYFAQLRDRFWDGVFFYALAVACFVRLLTLRPEPAGGERGTPFWSRLWQGVRQHPLRAWALAIALITSYTAIRLNEAGRPGEAVLFWLSSVAAGILAWAGLRAETGPGEPSSAEAAAGDAGPTAGPLLRWEVLAVVGCTALALLLRLVRLGTVPYVISGDEASMGLEAVNVLEGRLVDPFATGWLSHPTLYFFMLSGPVALLGRNAWGLRLLSPLVGTAAVPLLYFLARRLLDRRIALAGMVLLACSHLSIHFSRLGINNIYDPLFGLVAFFFLVRGLQEGRLIDFALSGAALAVAQFFYMGARLLPVMVAAFFLLWWVQRPRERRLFGPGAVLGGTFLLTGAPLLRFFLLHPADFMARVRIVGIIQSGWLQSEQAVTGKTALGLLWDQLRKSLLAFNYTVDPTSWYAAPIPYLDFVSAVLFVLGLVVLLRHWRRMGHLVVHVWFWLCLFVGGMLVENPPSSPRFVIFMPAVCLIAGMGLVALLDTAGKLLPAPRPWLNRALVAVLAIAALLNVQFYFLQYTPSGAFGGLNTEVGTRVGDYLQAEEPGSQVYFFGPPRMWVNYATIPFLAPGMALADVEQPLPGPPVPPLGAGDTLFIALPERAGELYWVEQAYPQGRYSEYRGHEGTVLFAVYRVDR